MLPINSPGGTKCALAIILASFVWLLAPHTGRGQEKEPKKDRERHIGEVIIVGNTFTPDAFIRDQLNLVPGQILRYPELKIAERNLAKLGWFAFNDKKNIRPTVQVLDDGKGGPFTDILVKVQERPGNRLRIAVIDLVIFHSTWDYERLLNASNLLRDEICESVNKKKNE